MQGCRRLRIRDRKSREVKNSVVKKGDENFAGKPFKHKVHGNGGSTRKLIWSIGSIDGRDYQVVDSFAGTNDGTCSAQEKIGNLSIRGLFPLDHCNLSTGHGATKNAAVNSVGETGLEGYPST